MHEFFPPLKSLTEALGVSVTQLNSNDTVTIPASMLKGLIIFALNNLDIDCDVYLENNSDVNNALSNQGMERIRRHFIAAGYFEGRGVPLKIDERYYLQSNLDVRDAFLKGVVESARKHFEKAGIYEGRSPSVKAHADAEFWNNLLFRRNRK